MSNPIRASLKDVATRVRQLIGDPSDDWPTVSATPLFTDQQVQDQLDIYRYNARFIPLRIAPTFQPGGITHFWDYFAEYGYWEADAVIYDNAFNVITTAQTLVSQDLLTGHWVFQDNPGASPIPGPYGQQPVVRLTGKTYDVYAAAADLLELKLPLVAGNYDFTSNNQSFKASQEFMALTKLVAQYRTQERPHNVTLFREDNTDPTYLPTNQWYDGQSTGST